MLADKVKFCPRCGHRLEQGLRFGRVRPFCPNCEWIYFADPKVAAAALVQQDQKVLLVRRAFNPARGLWTLPAGFVDAGEDPARAAERECLEETGLSARVTRLVDVLFGQEHPRGAHILIVYQAEIISGRMHPGDDASEVSFFSLNQLPPLAFSATRRILSA